MNNDSLTQTWASYGPRAECGPFGILIWPTKLVHQTINFYYYYTFLTFCNAQHRKGFQYFSIYACLLHVIYFTQTLHLSAPDLASVSYSRTHCGPPGLTHTSIQVCSDTKKHTRWTVFPNVKKTFFSWTAWYFLIGCQKWSRIFLGDSPRC